MGADTRLWLPYDVEHIHITAALNRLFNDNTERNPFSSSPTMPLPDTPGMLRMTLSAEAQEYASKIPGHAWNYEASWHFQSRNEDGTKVGVLGLGRANARMIAVSRRLAGFFGGEITPNDCGEDEVEHYERTCPTDEHGLIPHDDPQWSKFWEAIKELPPITHQDIQEAEKQAAYPTRDTYWNPTTQ